MTPIHLRALVRIEVSVAPPIDLGGERRYIPFQGGTFTGFEGIRGELLAGGVDWQMVRPDGVVEIDAHYALRSEEGETIEVRSIGLRKASPAVTHRLARGEDVTPDEYYFRTHIRLSTSAPRLLRLNDLLAVSTGQRFPDLVRIDVHEVL
jgi:hypothetical protein